MTDREWRWYVLVAGAAIGACLVSIAVTDLIVWWGR